MSKEFKLNSIPEAIEALKLGKMIIVVDDEDRENEGDFIMLADKVRPEDINFMAKYGRGLICVALQQERLQELDIPLMVGNNTSLMNTAFTISVDYKFGISTGISAFDRAKTIQALNDPATKPSDFAKPGHIFPLAAEEGGVLKRAGHTEAVVDFARLAGVSEVGVLCEIMEEDGSMARLPSLVELAKEHDLCITSVRKLIHYRHKTEVLVENIASAEFPTKWGHFTLHAFKSKLDNEEHLAIVKGDVNTEEPILVRVHSQCLTGDILGSLRCDCGDQLQTALQDIEKEGRGVVLYMRQEGRGIGLGNKIKAYHLQDKGHDTVEANLALGFQPDLRDYGLGAQILFELGIRNIRLLTNNPKKIVGLEGYGLKVTERLPIEITANEVNACYLTTKRDKMGHLIMQQQDNKVETE